MVDISGMFNGGRFDKDQPYFFSLRSKRAMRYTFGYDVEFAGFECHHLAISKFNMESAFLHEEEFIFRFVLVPDKITGDFSQFDVLAI